MLERRSSDAFSASERYSKLANSISFPPSIEFGLPSNEKGCSLVRDSKDARKRRKIEEGGDSKTLSNSHSSSNNINSASGLSGTGNSSGKDGMHSVQIPESKKTLQSSFDQSPLKRTSSIDTSEANNIQQACFSLFMPRSSTANSFNSTVGEVSAGSSHSVYAALADSAYAPSYSRDALASNLPDSISSPALNSTRAPQNRNTSKGGSAGNKSRSYRTNTKASSYSPKRSVNFTVAVQGAPSSILLSPCSVCYRRIAQTEVFFRCDGCNYFECCDCYPLDISAKAAKNSKAKERVRRRNSQSGQRLPQSFNGVHRGSESRDFATSKTSTRSSSSSEGCSASFSAALEEGHEHQLKPCKWVVNNPENNQPVVANKKFTSEGNRIINDYVVVKMISRGSFATVKLVQHVYSGELFALKILKKFKKRGLTGKKSKKSENLESEQKRISDELLREIAVMRLVNHPNIVKLQEVIDDVEEEKIYIIMEYCSGGPIHVLGNPALPVEKARLYGSQLASALLYLHSEFLYHRDVKPANVLVDAKGVAKLVDFGTCNSRIRTNMAAGTPAYSCPELVRGEEVSGEVVDSWAFAVTLFEMAYGKLPFSDAATVYSLRNFLLSDAPIVVPSHHADRAIEDLLRQMLNKDRRNRIVLKEAVKHSFFTLHNPMPGAMRGTIIRSRGPKGKPALPSASSCMPESMISFPANLSVSMGNSMPALGGMGANESLREIALSTVRRGRKVGEAMSNSVFASPAGASVTNRSGTYRNSITSDPSTNSSVVPGRMRSPTISLMDAALTTVRKGRNLRETMTRRRIAPEVSVVQASESPSKQNQTQNSASTRDSGSKREIIPLSPPKPLLPSNLYGIGRERKMSSSICSSSSGSISTILSSLLSSPDDAPVSSPVGTDTSGGGGGGGTEPPLASGGKSEDGKGTVEKSHGDRRMSAATSNRVARPSPVIGISPTVRFMTATDTIHHGYPSGVASPDAAFTGKRYANHTRRIIRADSCDSDATLSSSGKRRVALQQPDEKEEDSHGESGTRHWDRSSRVKGDGGGTTQTNGEHREKNRKEMVTGASTHLAQSHMGKGIDQHASPMVGPLSLKEPHPTPVFGAGGPNDGSRPQGGKHMVRGTDDKGDYFDVDHRRSSANDSLLLQINANRCGRRKKKGEDNASNRKTEVPHGQGPESSSYPPQCSNLHDIELLQRTPSSFPEPPVACEPTMDIFSMDLREFSEILRVPRQVTPVAGGNCSATAPPTSPSASTIVPSTDDSAASVPPRGEVPKSDATERKDPPMARHPFATDDEKHQRSHSPSPQRQKLRPPPLQLLRNLKPPSRAGGDTSSLTSSNPSGDFDLRSPFQPVRPPHGALRQMGKPSKGLPPPSRGGGSREELAGPRIGPSPVLKRGSSPFFSPDNVAPSSAGGEGNWDAPPPSRGSPRPLTRPLPPPPLQPGVGVTPPAPRPRTRSSRVARINAHSIPGAGESTFSANPSSPPRGMGKPLGSQHGAGGVRPGSRVGMGVLSPLGTADATGLQRGGGFHRRGPSVPHLSRPLSSLNTIPPIPVLPLDDAGREWGGHRASPSTHHDERKRAEKEVVERHGILPGPALLSLPPPPPLPAVPTESCPPSILGAVVGPPQGRYRHRQPLVHIVESGEDDDRFPDCISYSVLKKQSSLCSGGSSAVMASTPLSTNGISSGSERGSDAGQHEDELPPPPKRLLGSAVVKFPTEANTRTGSEFASGKSPPPPQIYSVSSLSEEEPTKGANQRHENGPSRRKNERMDPKVEYTETKAPPYEHRVQRSTSVFSPTKETGGAIGSPAFAQPKKKKEELQRKSKRNNETSRSRRANFPKAAMTAIEGSVPPPPSR